jgi:DNA-binding NarL/FixJ family response regulator
MDAGEETDGVGPVRVVLVDDSDEVREVFRLALDRQDEFEVVGEAADGQAGIDVVSAHKPHLVLLDIAMPLMDGLQALGPIRQVSPGSVVIMLTGVSETAGALSAVEQGAHGYIRKGGNFPEMLAQIREVFEVRLESRSRALLRRVPADAESAAEGPPD